MLGCCRLFVIRRLSVGGQRDLCSDRKISWLIYKPI